MKVVFWRAWLNCSLELDERKIDLEVKSVDGASVWASVRVKDRLLLGLLEMLDCNLHNKREVLGLVSTIVLGLEIRDSYYLS